MGKKDASPPIALELFLLTALLFCLPAKALEAVYSLRDVIGWGWEQTGREEGKEADSGTGSLLPLQGGPRPAFPNLGPSSCVGLQFPAMAMGCWEL